MPEGVKASVPHPLQAVQMAPTSRVFAFFLALTLVLMAVLLLVDRPLQTAAPRGIISFEFAGSVARAEEIVRSWEGAPTPFAGFSLGLDYLYMVTYATTMHEAPHAAGILGRANGGGLKRFARKTPELAG